MDHAATSSSVLERLDGEGLLLVHDQRLPSVTRLVTGGAVTGSWWSHPLAHTIYDALEAIEAEVAMAKLVRGKETLVARRLWPALLSAVASRQGWQVEGLDHGALDLLDEVESAPVPLRVERDQRAAAKVLEQRLLVQAAGIHTDAGRHTKALTSWRDWAASRGVPIDTSAVASAQGSFQRIVDRWASDGAVGGGKRLLPW
jgi:hypothetical protein